MSHYYKQRYLYSNTIAQEGKPSFFFFFFEFLFYRKPILSRAELGNSPFSQNFPLYRCNQQIITMPTTRYFQINFQKFLTDEINTFGIFICTMPIEKISDDDVTNLIESIICDEDISKEQIDENLSLKSIFRIYPKEITIDII